MTTDCSRDSHESRGLKHFVETVDRASRRRDSHESRGLKLSANDNGAAHATVATHTSRVD